MDTNPGVVNVLPDLVFQFVTWLQCKVESEEEDLVINYTNQGNKTRQIKFSDFKVFALDSRYVPDEIRNNPILKEVNAKNVFVIENLKKDVTTHYPVIIKTEKTLSLFKLLKPAF